MEYRQLLGLGRAAAAYGQTMAARQLYEAAGAWSELLSLCALQGDFMSVRDYMQSVRPLLPSCPHVKTPFRMERAIADILKHYAQLNVSLRFPPCRMHFCVWLRLVLAITRCSGGQRGSASGQGTVNRC